MSEFSQYFDAKERIDRKSLDDVDLMFCDLQAAVDMGFVLGEDLFINRNELRFMIIIDEDKKGKGVLYPRSWIEMSYIISALEMAGFKKGIKNE